MVDLLKIEEYSERSFVVRGNTRPHKNELSKRLGKWNPNLKDGPGWIFSNQHRKNVEKYINVLNSGENNSGENKASDNNSGENKASDNNSGENNSGENKASDNNSGENNSGENKVSDNNSEENKVSDNNSEENNSGENVFSSVNTQPEKKKTLKKDLKFQRNIDRIKFELRRQLNISMIEIEKNIDNKIDEKLFKYLNISFPECKCKCVYSTPVEEKKNFKSYLILVPLIIGMFMMNSNRFQF